MPSQPLYLQLAGHYRQAIQAGTLRPGDRMPALRVLSERHGVSLSTALQTCRHLESLGWLEARPRSGYFVQSPVRPRLEPPPEPPAVLPDPAQFVGIHERVSSVVARGRLAPVRFNLGGAAASAPLYPCEALRTASLRALRREPALWGQAVPHTGHPAFCAAVAKHLLSSGIVTAPREVIVTHGGTEALALALRAVARPGDVVAVESPAYYGLLQLLESLGLRALEIPTSAQTGLSLEALDLAAASYEGIRAVVFVPHLQNPLGATMPAERRRQLVQWCEAHDIVLIEDDTFGPLYDADAPLPAAKSFDTTGNVIHCASLHKVLAPGMRLGWVLPGRWRSRIEMLKFTQSRGNEVLSQLAAADFIGSGSFERHLQRLRARLRRHRDWMAAAIAAGFPQETRLSLPRGGVHLWLELPPGTPSESVFDAALREGIRVAPGLMFSNSGRFDHCLRINCGLPPSPELGQALKRLGCIVAEAG